MSSAAEPVPQQSVKDFSTSLDDAFQMDEDLSSLSHSLNSRNVPGPDGRVSDEDAEMYIRAEAASSQREVELSAPSIPPLRRDSSFKVQAAGAPMSEPAADRSINSVLASRTPSGSATPNYSKPTASGISPR